MQDRDSVLGLLEARFGNMIFQTVFEGQRLTGFKGRTPGLAR